jgi:Fic family protein
MEFFLTGVAETAEQAADTAREVMSLFDHDRATIAGLGRAAPSALQVHEFLQKRPLVTIGAVAKELKISVPTVTNALNLMVDANIVREITGRQRGRVFEYPTYLRLLDKGTEPLPA